MSFPGRIFDGEGLPADGRRQALTQEVIDGAAHRSMVTARDLAPVAWVWLLDDTATFAAIPQNIRDSAVDLVERGHAILILARHPAAEVDVRDGLLAILPDTDLVFPDTEGEA